MTSTHLHKKKLRKHYRELRNNLSSALKQQAAIKIAQHLIKLPEYEKAQHIGVYSALGEEASLSIFNELAAEDQKSLYLPVISKNLNENLMHFESWSPEAPTDLNSLGIYEPQKTKNSEHLEQAVPSFDLLLLPLVAYDKKGNRLGMGAGYYDRFIEKNISKNCLLIGIAFSCQETLDIPQEAWDKKLHALVNEKETLYFT